jgi:hypothetical protein
VVEVNVDVDMVEVDFNKDKVGKLKILLRILEIKIFFFHVFKYNPSI